MVGMAFRVVVAVDGELEVVGGTRRGVAWHVVVMGFVNDFGPHVTIPKCLLLRSL